MYIQKFEYDSSTLYTIKEVQYSIFYRDLHHNNNSNHNNHSSHRSCIGMKFHSMFHFWSVTEFFHLVSLIIPTLQHSTQDSKQLKVLIPSLLHNFSTRSDNQLDVFLEILSLNIIFLIKKIHQLINK